MLKKKDSSSYERSLDIENAISTVKYRIGKVEYTREAFVSYPHQVMVVRLTSSIPGDHIGLVVVVELDTGTKHEGILEESNVYGYIKIINASEMFFVRLQNRL